MLKIFPARFNHKQAEESAKLLLGLSQTSLIGTVGVIFLSDGEWFYKIFLIFIGIILAIILYTISINLLK